MILHSPLQVAPLSNQPAAPVLDLQRRCEGCGDLVAVHAAIRCGTHTHCALCALSSLCFDCKALLIEELRERAEDAAYDAGRDAQGVAR